MRLHAALWRYESDHGKLPGKLTDLVPTYLKQADLEAPAPHEGETIFRLVRPLRPTSDRRPNDYLLLSVPFGESNDRCVYVQEDGDVGVR